MNGYTMALPHCPIPKMFPVNCGTRVVFGNALVSECAGDHSQTPAYMSSPKRIKQESDHGQSYPLSPASASTPPECHGDLYAYEDRQKSPMASRKVPRGRETCQNLPNAKFEMSRATINNAGNASNNNNNTNTHNNNCKSPANVSLSDGSIDCLMSRREGHCKSSDFPDCVNVSDTDEYKSVSTSKHPRLSPSSSPLRRSVTSSPSSPFSHSTISVLPAKSLSPLSSHPQPSPPSISSSSLFISSPDIKQERKQERNSTDDVESHKIEEEKSAEDGRNSRLSCIVDIERDTPPLSPVISPSPSHSPLNLSKSCLASTTSASDVDNHNDTQRFNLDTQRFNLDTSKTNSEKPCHDKHQNDTASECDGDDEETKRRKKTNFSIDAILSSKFGVANSTAESALPLKEEQTDERESSPERTSSLNHSENSAFSAVDLSVKALHSSTSLSPSSNISSSPSSPQLFLSPLTRSPNECYGNASITEEENFNKSTNDPHIGRHHPYSHLFKMAQSAGDSARSIEEVFGDSKNNINANNMHPFQRFFPTMLPSHFPSPKHGSSAPVADMEDFFHRNFPLLNQAYNHFVGKFPFVYLPPEQSFPLHNISKMHPDPNPLFDHTRVLAMPQSNPLHHDRSPPGLLPGNPRFHPNFANVKELSENINPKSNRSLMTSPYNANNIIGGSLKQSSLHHSKSHLASTGSRNCNAILPPVPHLPMDGKHHFPVSKTKDSSLPKPVPKSSPTPDELKSEKIAEDKSTCGDVTNFKPDPIKSPESQENADNANSGQGNDGNSLWPAWVFCTRYSDRPSSGPRSRKHKRKASVDEKRPRTAFTNDQLQRLKREFEDCRYLTETRRRNLATELGLSESQIKIWFQNKRAKIKKSMGVKNTLAIKLMEEGLYNHSTVKSQEEAQLSG